MRWTLSSGILPRAAALIWDVDGTLTDTTALIIESLDFTYRRHFGRTLHESELRALIGTPLKIQIRVFGDPEALGVDPQAAMDDFVQHYERNKARERILEPVIALLIRGKREGFPTALVTSKNHEELDNTLPRLQIADYVDFAITADDVRNPKPDPEGLEMALARFGILGRSAFFIGDTVHDMRAARCAGVCGIGVTWGAATRAQLEQERPVAICDTPQELELFLFPPQ
jgi:HAD superfamily hydrolase (TIGR01549 family)